MKQNKRAYFLFLNHMVSFREAVQTIFIIFHFNILMVSGIKVKTCLPASRNTTLH